MLYESLPGGCGLEHEGAKMSEEREALSHSGAAYANLVLPQFA
jgi:hypothetical protein